MRRLFRLVLLIAIMSIPAYALVLPNEPSHSDASATSSPSTASPSSSAYIPPTAAPRISQPSAASTVPLQTSSPSGQSSAQQSFADQMSVQQRNELLKQSKSLSTQQLEAIAKSFQSQQTAQPYPQPTASPQQQPYAGQQLQGTYPEQPQSGGYVGQQGAYATQPQAGYPSAQPQMANQGYQEAEPDLMTHIARQRETSASIDRVKRDQAFSMLLEEVLPLSPEQIKRLHRFYDLTLQAKATPPNASPEPHFTSTRVRLDPGCPTPVVRLAAGFITSILFIDATGAPWPITAYSLGDPESYNIQWDQKTNVIFVQSRKIYAHGNLAVRLYGLDTPVMITLVSGQKNVDFRVDMQVGERGPEAKAPIAIDTIYDAKVNPILINLLDGIPPKASVKLAVIGGYGDAWAVDNKIYFRTKLTVLSPAWVATVAGPDGTHVYEMLLTPYIVASQNGKTVDIKLSGL